MAGVNFTFEIVSKKFGRFVVTAPGRFRQQIETHKWHVAYDKGRAEGKQFHVRTNIPVGPPNRQASLDLHRLIWKLSGRPTVKQVDHADGQPLNNSEDNLRDGGNGGNQKNVGKRRDNTSGIIGVWWQPRNKKWRARIKVEGRYVALGMFRNVEDATAARDRAAALHYGEYAVLNAH